MSSKKSKILSSQTDITNESQTIEEPVLEPQPEKPPDIRTITITINSFRNILPLYPTSDIKAELKYLNTDLGETKSIPVTDEENLPVTETFEINIDVDSVQQIDQLASNPVFITATQSSGAFDESLYEQLQVSRDVQEQPEQVESLFSLYEAFTGEKPAVQITEGKKKKKDKPEKPSRGKSRSKSVTSKKSKQSKSSKGSIKSGNKEKSDISTSVKSEIYGMCVIDLIPLFFGKTSFKETLLLQPVTQSCEILSTFKNFPEVSIEVTLKNSTILIDIKNILYFTVESICNVPSLMLADMDCTVCVMLPLQDNGASPTVFHNPKITSKKPPQNVPKRWPGVLDIGYNANTTKYMIDVDFDEVINKSNLQINEGFQEDSPRIEFNYLKRNMMFRNASNDFAAHVVTYRKIVLEIYLTPKSKKPKASDAFSADEDQTKARQKASKALPYLHLMAVIDVVALLYPGVTKLRVASPVKTFTYDEAALNGLTDSYFMPKPKVDTTSSKIGGGKKKDTDKKDKVSKKDKASGIKEDKNLAVKLPPQPEEPPPPEPSEQIYNEDGKPCFILIEIELQKPIFPKRDVEDLELSLRSLQLEALQSSKTILNKSVADDLYRQTIKEIIDDLTKHWNKYNELINTVPLPKVSNFIEYLQKIGAYQSYVSSITTSATLLINNKYQCKEKDFKNNKTYQNLISEIFTELISQMHAVLNNMVCSGMKALADKYPKSLGDVLFYAKEATELEQYQTADRYFLERICSQDSPNPDFWVDYAIFNIELNSSDKAFECLKEAISMNSSHRYALLLYALLLADKDNIQNAETCLLNLMVLESKWAVGWCILYLFYQKSNRLDGMEVAVEMGKKCMSLITASDYLLDFEDLAWCGSKIPDTLFFRTALLLLKFRLFSWVELAIAEEVLVPKHYGYVNYLLAVVRYYRKDYEHALEHLEEAKEHLGADYGVLSLSGHTLLKQGKFLQAKEEYFKVIESFNRPEDIHLVYVNCSTALSKLGDDQNARKLILLACKQHQSPYVWFSAGKLYFYENDLLSAEECFNEANMKDNQYPEVWAYLTLVNLKLSRLHEAEQCYQQAVKSQLDDQVLLANISAEFAKLKK